MPRSNIRAKTIDTIDDNGSVIISIAQGEQFTFNVTCDWISDYSLYDPSAAIVEADNVEGDLDDVPFLPRTGGLVTNLVCQRTASSFTVRIPTFFSQNWAVQPTPDDPTYGFFAFQIEENVLATPPIYVPLRGLIEVRYNPVQELP